MDWHPMSEAPEAPGTYINVRSVTSYRWLAYKKDGARQMRAPGRWQRATEHGWENCPKPDGEWTLIVATEVGPAKQDERKNAP